MSTTEPNDTREMRQRINRAGYGYERVDGKEMGPSNLPPAAAMIRAVLTAAEYQGLSGEDAMTMLAYNALVGYERLHDHVLQEAMLNPSPPLIVRRPT